MKELSMPRKSVGHIKKSCHGQQTIAYLQNAMISEILAHGFVFSPHLFPAPLLGD